MNARRKRRVEAWAANGLLGFAVGLRLTLWAYDHVAFFLPGMTARRLREQAGRMNAVNYDRAWNPFADDPGFGDTNVEAVA